MARQQAAAIDPSTVRLAVQGPAPAALQLQLASLVDNAPAGDDWLHEIKFDGYRMLARIAGGQARFISRNGNDWTAKFPELAKYIQPKCGDKRWGYCDESLEDWEKCPIGKKRPHKKQLFDLFDQYRKGGLAPMTDEDFEIIEHIDASVTHDGNPKPSDVGEPPSFLKASDPPSDDIDDAPPPSTSDDAPSTRDEG